METKQILEELKAKISSGEISKTEIQSIINSDNSSNFVSGANIDISLKDEKKTTVLTKILYTIGAIVIILGVIFFVGQIWSDIGTAMRVIVTLGLGIVFAVSGCVLMSTTKRHLGSIFNSIAGVLVVIGIFVTIYEFDLTQGSLWPTTIIFGALFAIYVLLSKIYRSVELTFFAIYNGTTFIYLLTESVYTGPFYLHFDFLAYVTMLIGAGYIILGRAFESSSNTNLAFNKPLVSYLNLFGSIAVLGAAFSQVFDSGFWKILFVLLVLGGVVLAIFLRSRIILTASVLFLIVHIIYITGEFFANSMGWPLALILFGFIFLALGYASVSISRKYIQA